MLLLDKIRTWPAVVLVIAIGAFANIASATDCNSNGIPDHEDIAQGFSRDVDINDVPDECQPDCNNNDVPDGMDIAGGTSSDCNSNGVPDECDIGRLLSRDTNANGVPDECEDAAPALTNALSQKRHGTGLSAVTRSIVHGGVECRSGGITTVTFFFDKRAKATDGTELSASDFILSRGTVTNMSAAWLALSPYNGSVKLTISGVDTPGPFRIAFAAENTIGVEDQYEVCWTYVPGDVDGDGDADSADEAAIIAVHYQGRGTIDMTRFDLDLDNVAECQQTTGDDWAVWSSVAPISHQILCYESDCNTNGIPDDLDIAYGTCSDVNSNGIPDECGFEDNPEVVEAFVRKILSDGTYQDTIIYSNDPTVETVDPLLLDESDAQILIVQMENTPPVASGSDDDYVWSVGVLTGSGGAVPAVSVRGGITTGSGTPAVKDGAIKWLPGDVGPMTSMCIKQPPNCGPVVPEDFWNGYDRDIHGCKNDYEGCMPGASCSNGNCGSAPPPPPSPCQDEFCSGLSGPPSSGPLNVPLPPFDEGGCYEVLHTPTPSGTAGEAMHMDIVTGNVWTQVPVFESQSDRQGDLRAMLSYSSIRRGDKTDVGYGWTHGFSHQIKLIGYFEWPDATAVSCWWDWERPPWSTQYQWVKYCTRYEPEFHLQAVVYTDETGRRHVFRNSIPVAGGKLGFHKHHITNPTGNSLISGLSYKLDVLRPNGTILRFSSAYKRGVDIIDRHGRCTRIREGGGEILVESGHGRQCRLIDGPSGNIERIIRPDGEETTLEYVNGNLTKITDPMGYYREFGYDNDHRIISETLKNGTSYTVGYTANGRWIKDSLDNSIVNVSCANGLMDELGTTPSAGNVYYTDARGKIWTYARDTHSRITRITDPDGNYHQYTYGGSGDGDDYNRLIKREFFAAGQTAAEWYDEYRHDSWGNVTWKKDRGGNEYSYEYNCAAAPRRPTKITYPGGRVWEYMYTDQGDMETIIDPIDETLEGAAQDATITFEYTFHDPSYRTGPLDRDLPGRFATITRTDRNNHVQKSEFDCRGNLIRTTEGLNVLNVITDYEHDSMGWIASRTVYPGGSSQPSVIQFRYDEMGRPIQFSQSLTMRSVRKSSFTYDGRGNLATETDFNGVVSSYHYDHRNRLIKVIRDVGGLEATESWNLDENGNVEHYWDANTDPTAVGAVPTMHIVYDDLDRVDYVTDGEGYTTDLTFNSVGNLTNSSRMIGPDNLTAEMRWQYDDLGRPEVITVENGTTDLVTQIDYHIQGCSCGASPNRSLPSKITDAAGKVTYYKYDELDRLVEQIHKVGDTTSEDCDGVDDVCHSFEYDAKGNLVAAVDPMGLRTVYDYDEADRLITQTVDPAPGEALTSTLNWDGAGRIASATMPNGNTTVMSYDRAGRSVGVSDSFGALMTLSYDDNGNILSRTDANNNTWSFTYDNLNRLTRVFDSIVESPDKCTELEYDAVGNRTMMINAKGVRTKLEYDRLNRLAKTIEDYCDQAPCASSTANRETDYVYDGAGRVLTMTDDDGNTTTYSYDAAGRMEQVAYPDDNGSGDHVVGFAYDLAMNQVTRTDQRGIAATTTFDDLYRPTNRSYVQNGTTLATETLGYDLAGRMLSAVNTSSGNTVANLSFAYDHLGRLEQTTQTYVSNGRSYVTDFSYSVNPATMQSIRTVQYPAWGTPAQRRSVVETMDGRGRLQSVSGGPNVGANWSHDLTNRRTAATMGNGVTSAFSYDVNGQLTGIRHESGPMPDLPAIADIYDVKYGYDVLGNRIHTENRLHNTRSELYEYDNLNRLIKFGRGQLNAAKDAISTPLMHNILANSVEWPQGPTAGLDSRGNWLSHIRQVGSGSVTETRAANGANEFTQIDLNGDGTPPFPVMTYDEAGNLTQDESAPNVGTYAEGQRYVYDHANRLVCVMREYMGTDQIILAISYDALGRRILTAEYIDASDGGLLTVPRVTDHVFDGLNVIQENVIIGATQSEPADGPAREFVWGAGFPEPIAMIDYTDYGSPETGGGEVFHYLHDVLGSVVALTDSVATVVERYEYDPYGTTSVSDADFGNARIYSMYGNPYMWTGQRFDATTRLYHSWARTYSPRLGRWLQRDPLGYVDGASLYEYVRSSPTAYIDPSGGGSVAPRGEREAKPTFNYGTLSEYSRFHDLRERQRKLMREYNSAVAAAQMLYNFSLALGRYAMGLTDGDPVVELLAGVAGVITDIVGVVGPIWAKVLATAASLGLNVRTILNALADMKDIPAAEVWEWKKLTQRIFWVIDRLQWVVRLLMRYADYLNKLILEVNKELEEFAKSTQKKYQKRWQRIPVWLSGWQSWIDSGYGPFDMTISWWPDYNPLQPTVAPPYDDYWDNVTGVLPALKGGCPGW